MLRSAHSPLSEDPLPSLSLFNAWLDAQGIIRHPRMAVKWDDASGWGCETIGVIDRGSVRVFQAAFSAFCCTQANYLISMRDPEVKYHLLSNRFLLRDTFTIARRYFDRRDTTSDDVSASRTSPRTRV